MRLTIALFGESEKGTFTAPYLVRSVSELADQLGEPPSDSVGLHLAIQALLLERQLLFFRVTEEGYSVDDYFRGLNQLRQQGEPRPNAICLPGVGDANLIDLGARICALHHSFLLVSEADMYDFLTT